MKYLDELKKLNLPKGKYAVFGSGPLAIRKIRQNKDIDIIVKEDLWDELKKKYTLAKNGSLTIGDIEIWNNWLPWIKYCDRIIDDSELIEGICFVKLEHVIEWKKMRNSDKDKKDLELIRAFLSSRDKFKY